jgi:hypothetical protein
MLLDCCFVVCGAYVLELGAAAATNWHAEYRGCIRRKRESNVNRSLWPRPQHPQLPLPKQHYYGALSLLLLVVLAIVVAVFVHLVVA